MGFGFFSSRHEGRRVAGVMEFVAFSLITSALPCLNRSSCCFIISCKCFKISAENIPLNCFVSKNLFIECERIQDLTTRIPKLRLGYTVRILRSRWRRSH